MLQDRVYWLSHKGKDILYCNFRKLNEDEIIEVIRHAEHFILHSGKRNIIKANDVRDIDVSTSLLVDVKRTSVVLQPYLKKSAYIGLSGTRKFLLDLVNSISHINARPFTSQKQAIDWLVED